MGQADNRAEDGGTSDTDPGNPHEGSGVEQPSAGPEPMRRYKTSEKRRATVRRYAEKRKTLTVRVTDLESRVEELEDFCAVVNSKLEI